MHSLQINFDFAKPEIRIPGADFWSCNGLHVLSEPAGLKATGWFQIHQPADLDKEKQEHLDWLFSPHEHRVWVNPETFVLIASKNAEIASAARLWPLPQNMLDALWTWPFPVSYSCTFSYQIAMAIWMGYDTIDISDVRLSDLREKALEAPNVLLWAGEAHRRGIKVLLSDEYTWEFKYGREERLTNIPYWVDRAVANDMFPGWSRETRELFHAYAGKQATWEAERAIQMEQTRQRIKYAVTDNS